ncbi:hypothetical protein GJAV_G00026240 [Gymnothorax javanicus]|nr:hypothetical protein GJAV_G00026240 [Gymnothorax javanicus]
MQNWSTTKQMRKWNHFHGQFCIDVGVESQFQSGDGVESLKNNLRTSCRRWKNCRVASYNGDRTASNATNRPRRLYEDKKSIIVFVKNFLCYTCKEYVEDLAKVPEKSLLSAGVRLVVIGQSSHCHIEPFCTLTRFPHEMYVDPERKIYNRLGMRRGETYSETAEPCPHVKSSALWGTFSSLWRAMKSPAFDFQGDPLQQGGAMIAGPAGSEIHFLHLDMNRLDNMPINWLLQLAGVDTVDFSDQPKIIHV